MNTRIQVEHGLRSCNRDRSGQRANISCVRKELEFPDDVLLSGHAIQCRINAEDPKSFILPLEK